MGVVYKARDPLIGRLVAMKTITSGLADQPEMLERFYREAQAAGGLQHPNIVTIYDLGKEENTPYIAMEFLEGISLEKIIEERRSVPLSQKIGYILDVCRALDYAHRRGVVHRDIKPANIVITTDGTIKVVDFGIARLVDTSRSQTGLLIGTVNYMSPEQVRGEKVDGRSDIFSVGVMFYELLTGERPFAGNNFTAVMLAIITQEPKPVSALLPESPPEIDTILSRILRKDANERYQAMEEVLLDLEPVHRRLQQEAVSQMVAESQKLIASQELEKARDVLRQALLIDTSHREAKTLLEKVNSELRRGLVVPRLNEMVSHASELLKQGKLAEARAEAESALKLDTSFRPAKELLQKVQEELKRQEMVREWMTTTRQRLAEGNVTAAEQQLDKLLELESANPDVQKLKQQIAEEKQRRIRRQHFLETMQQARNLWTHQKFEDSLKLLETLRSEFPGEPEIEKLIDTVRADRDELIKHEKMTEARRLLGEQKFGEAITVLDGLLEQHPADTTIQKLRSQVLAERTEHARRVRLQHEQDKLKKLVAEENYVRAIEQGESALKEFADDIEIARLVEFARNQHAHLEQQRRLKEKQAELDALMAAADFEKAIAAAEKALDAFPGHPEFSRVLEEARAKKAEKDKREYLEKQIRSMKAAIERGDLTAAIETGNATIAQVKHDTDVTRLLHMASREREMRDQARQRDDLMKTAVFMLNEQRFEEAEKVLKDVQKTSVFDPRVHSLLEAARTKQVPDEQLQKTVIGQLGVTPEQQYVLQAPGAPRPAEVKDAAAAPAPGTPEAVPPPPPPGKAAPAVEPPAREAPPSKKKGKGGPAVAPPPPPAKAKPVVEEPVKEKKEAAPPPAPEPKKPAVEPPPPAKAKPAVEEKPGPPAVKEAPPAAGPAAPPVKAKPAVEEKPAPPVEKPRPAPAPPKAPEVPVSVVAGEAKPVWKNPVVLGAAGVVLAAVIGFVVMRGPGTEPGETVEIPGVSTPSGPSQQELTLQAQGKQAWESRRLDDAVSAYRQLVGINGALKSEAQAELDRISKLRDDENRLFNEGQQAMDGKQWDTAIARFNEVVKLDGAKKNEATQAARLAGEYKAGRDPVTIERTAFNNANTAFQRGNFEEARNLYRQVVQMKLPNSALLPQAEARLKESEAKLAELAREKRAFDDASALFTAGNLEAARAKFQEVVQMNGALRSQAQQQISEINAAADRAATVARLTTEAEGFLSQGQLGQARQRAAQINQSGGDASALVARIDQAEQQRLNQLVQRFNTARQANDQNALTQLQGEFRTLVGFGGPAATQARDYAENQIPAALTAARGAADAAATRERERAEDSAWSDAEGDLNRAIQARNADGVRAAEQKFQAIARAGGRHASKAQNILATRIPEALGALRPCPAIRIAAAPPGMKPSVRPGDAVPPGLLANAATMAWTSCPYGQARAKASLRVTIKEDGSVGEIIPLGMNANDPAYLAAAAAVKNWKATPPQYEGGVPVQTQIPVYIDPL